MSTTTHLTAVKLTEKEQKAYDSWLESGSAPIATITQAKFFELFLNGKDCEEIARLNQNFEFGAIVNARIKGGWDAKRQDHLIKLLDSVRDRVQQVTLESINFVADLLSAAHKQHGDRIKRYLQTGNEAELMGIGITNLKHYRDAFELLQKQTGQDKTKGEILHKHTVEASDPIMGKAMSSDQASKILAILADEDE